MLLVPRKLLASRQLQTQQLLLPLTRYQHCKQVAIKAMEKTRTTVCSIGFDSLEEQVLLQDTGWQELYEDFALEQLQLPHAATQSFASILKSSSLMRHEVVGAVTAAVVAPVAQQMQIIQQLRSASSTVFIACWHPYATEDAPMRWKAFEAGANMVTHCRHALVEALHKVSLQQHWRPPLQLQQQQQPRLLSLKCDWCGLPGLSDSGYWVHQQLYHINHENKAGVCQICHRHSANLASHLHYTHNPTGQPPEERTGVFALAIVQRLSDGKFLMTQEFAGSGFWVPGGGVDPGETLVGGVVRECKEEAGVDVEVKGILALESHHSGAWRRVIFRAEPVDTATAHTAAAQGSTAMSAATDDDTTAAAASEDPQQIKAAHDVQEQFAVEQRDKRRAVSDLSTVQQQQGLRWRSRVGSCTCCSPKTLPDWESAGACWVSLDDLRHIPLRSKSEPSTWFPVMDKQGQGCDLPWYHTVELPREWAEGVFRGFPSTERL